MNTSTAGESFHFEIYTYFCAIESCALHVRPGDPGVHGEGNWATVRGCTVGRQAVLGRMLCDFCANGVQPPAG